MFTTAVTESLQVKEVGLLEEKKPLQTVAQAAERLETIRNRGILVGGGCGVVLGLGALAAAVCITVHVLSWPVDTSYALYVVGAVLTVGGSSVLLVTFLVQRRQRCYQGTPERSPQIFRPGPERIDDRPREVIKRIEVRGPPREVIETVDVRVPGLPREVVRRVLGSPPPNQGYQIVTPFRY